MLDVISAGAENLIPEVIMKVVEMSSCRFWVSQVKQCPVPDGQDLRS